MEQVALAFDWSPLGEAWWREAAADVGANELQTKYAAVTHRASVQGGGISQTEAARQAGYADSPDDPSAIRQAGYRASKSSAVVRLLALATAAMRGEVRGPVDAGVMRRELEKMATGGDPNAKLRAIGMLMDMEKSATFGQPPDDDGFLEWRLIRDYLRLPNGGAAVVLLWVGSSRALASIPMLHDVARAAQRQAPEMWARELSSLSPRSRAELDAHLSDPEWQIDARRQLWREVGVELSDSRPVDPIASFQTENIAVPKRRLNGGGDGARA